MQMKKTFFEDGGGNIMSDEEVNELSHLEMDDDKRHVYEDKDW